MYRPVRIFGATAAMAVLIAAGTQPSKADSIVTFTVSGIFATGSMNGTVTFDETSNTMPSVDINAPGTGAGPFTIPGFFSNPPDGSTGTFARTADASGDTLFLQFPTAAIANVSGYEGGPLMTDGTVIDIASVGHFDFLSAGSLTPLSTAPEPSSLWLTGTAGLALLALCAMFGRSRLRGRKAAIMATAAVLAASAAGTARADTTVFTDLPFNQYESGAVGVDGALDVAWANQFTAGSTANLSDAILALGNYNQEVLGMGTNSPITVDLESDAGGAPGSILATLTQQGTIPQYTSPGLVTFDYSGTPVSLTSGTTYWLVALETDPNSLQAWFLSNAGNGLDAVNYNGSATGPWTAGCPPGPGCSDGLNAFQVDGTTASAITPIPEPRFVSVLGLALMIGVAIVIRRRIATGL